MPAYTYECEKCGEIYDRVWNKIADHANGPDCCFEPTKQIILRPPIIDPRLGLDPDSFPTMGDKWANRQEQRLKKAQRRDSPEPESWF